MKTGSSSYNGAGVFSSVHGHGSAWGKFAGKSLPVVLVHRFFGQNVRVLRGSRMGPLNEGRTGKSPAVITRCPTFLRKCFLCSAVNETIMWQHKTKTLGWNDSVSAASLWSRYYTRTSCCLSSLWLKHAMHFKANSWHPAYQHARSWWRDPSCDYRQPCSAHFGGRGVCPLHLT